MVLFQTGYNRVPKMLEITGLYKEWDQKQQCFNLSNLDNIERNKEFLEIKKKYMKVAKEWEDEGRLWSSIQWSYSYDSQKAVTKEVKPIPILKVKVISVSKCFDIIIEDMKN